MRRLKLMNESDRMCKKYSYFDSRQITACLPRSEPHAGGLDRVRRLWCAMDPLAIYKGPNTINKHP